MQAPVTAAVITSATAVCVAVVTAGLGYWSRRRLDIRVTSLEKQQRDDDAWRSYTFDARKRLYVELGPLLFALVEACEELRWRVRGIARSAQEHRLEDDRSNRFQPGSDYMLSTLYRLMAPLAVARLVQAQLTLVDLSVDPAIDRIYALAKVIRRTWNGRRKLADLSELPYRPVGSGRTPETAKQHINLQAVDRLAECLIPDQQAAGAGALVGYSSFVAQYRSGSARIRAAAAPFERLLDRFHPDRRPVLWQLLEPRRSSAGRSRTTLPAALAGGAPPAIRSPTSSNSSTGTERPSRTARRTARPRPRRLRWPMSAPVCRRPSSTASPCHPALPVTRIPAVSSSPLRRRGARIPPGSSSPLPRLGGRPPGDPGPTTPRGRRAGPRHRPDQLAARQDGSRPERPSARSKAGASAGTGTSGPYQPPSRPMAAMPSTAARTASATSAGTS